MKVESCLLKTVPARYAIVVHNKPSGAHGFISRKELKTSWFTDLEDDPRMSNMYLRIDFFVVAEKHHQTLTQGNKTFYAFVELELHLPVPRRHTCVDLLFFQRSKQDRAMTNTDIFGVKTTSIHWYWLCAMCNRRVEQSIDQFLRGKCVKNKIK